MVRRISPFCNLANDRTKRNAGCGASPLFQITWLGSVGNWIISSPCSCHPISAPPFKLSNRPLSFHSFTKKKHKKENIRLSMNAWNRTWRTQKCSSLEAICQKQKLLRQKSTKKEKKLSFLASNSSLYKGFYVLNRKENEKRDSPIR